MDSALLTGRTHDFLCSGAETEALGAPIHMDVVEPFLQLKETAAEVGFDLRILSGFRSFERQRSIWNRKVEGELPVLDSRAEPLDIRRLSGRELAFSILRWSALPGASRHHWGTDLDVFDASTVPEGYEIELIPEEVETGGIFGPLHDWLDDRMSRSGAFGFFRPYDRDRSGVAPERWHLSCAPVAAAFEAEMTADLLRWTVQDSGLLLEEVVLDHIEEIYERFVTNIGRPPQ